MTKTVHAQISVDAASRLRPEPPCKNSSGETLHDWLIRAFDSMNISGSSHPSLFGTCVEVEDDVPTLLGALARLTNQSVDEMVEAWLLDSYRPAMHSVEAPSGKSVGVSDEKLGKVAHVLDLGETLFERTVADAREKLGGSYPEGEKVAQASAEVFRALRVLLGLRESNGNENVNGKS